MNTGHRERVEFMLRNWFWVWRSAIESNDRQLMAVCQSPHAARVIAYSLVKSGPEYYREYTCYVTFGAAGSAKSLYEVWTTPDTFEVRDEMTRTPELLGEPHIVDTSGSYPIVAAINPPETPK